MHMDYIHNNWNRITFNHNYIGNNLFHLFMNKVKPTSQPHVKNANEVLELFDKAIKCVLNIPVID